MMAVILNLAILDSAILVFPLKVTHTYQDWFPLFSQKKFTHSFCLNLMMAAILNSAMLDLDTAILDSNTLLSSLRFTQKHSSSTLILNHINIHLINLMMATILNSAILDSDTAILDSNTLLSPPRFTQKHSSSTLNLTQTNSISLT